MRRKYSMEEAFSIDRTAMLLVIQMLQNQLLETLKIKNIKGVLHEYGGALETKHLFYLA